MLERKDFMPLNYYKKEAFTGSFYGMRFMFRKKEVAVEGSDDKKKFLEAIIWPQPFSYEATAPEKRTSSDFSFNEDGIVAAIEWLNKCYEDRREEFEAAALENGL